MTPQRRTKCWLITAAVAVVVVAGVLPAVQVCRDWAYICENTGSRKGYRQWPFGLKTGEWYESSPLEQFLQSQEPGALVHRWTNYAGTGRNLWGGAMLLGHGRPGAVWGLDHETQRRWIERHDATEVRELYELLVSDDEAQIEKRVHEIGQEVYKH
ncbi:MAG: hypothetical protein JXB62_18150 [Pirellulales bacterium]|nr:hypothetical protein [Pirellulales bacterium]